VARDMWPGTWHSDAAEMLRNDLKDAQIPYEDERGRIFDFHALRHQFISNLASAGVHPKVVPTNNSVLVGGQGLASFPLRPAPD